MAISLIISLFILGIVAGVMSGMFGIGGGIVIVPVLVSFFGFSILEANGTSLAALMMPVGIFAVIEYYRQNLIKLRTASMLALGIIIGVWFGAVIAISVSQNLLKMLYGIFLIYICIKFFDLKIFKRNRNLYKTEVKAKSSYSLILEIILGIITGVLSGIFGIGGGIVMVPAMIAILKYDTKTAVGTSLAALLLPVALPGVIQYYNSGYFQIFNAGLIAVGLLIGSYFGAKINLGLNNQLAKRIYAIFLLCVATYFILNTLLTH